MTVDEALAAQPGLIKSAGLTLTWDQASVKERFAACMEVVARTHELHTGPLGLAGGVLTVFQQPGLRQEALDLLKSEEAQRKGGP